MSEPTSAGRDRGPAPAGPGRPSTRRRRLALVSMPVAATLALVVAIGVIESSGGGGGARAGAGAQPAPTVGHPAPAFSLTAIQGPDPVISSAELKGRPILLNFFASWCVPCKQELPLLAAAWRRDGARVAFVGVDSDDSPAAARGLLHASRAGYPVGSDPDNVVTVRYGIADLPGTVFIGADGRVVGVHYGALTASSLRSWLQRVAPPSRAGS